MKRALVLLVAAVLAAACGDDDPPPVDAGPDARDGAGDAPDDGAADGDAADGGPDADATPDVYVPLDAPIEGPAVCVGATRVAGETGTVTVSLDTTGAPEGELDLGPACGTGDAAPQVVVAYAVPGTGTQRVAFTTATSGTDEAFDTLVQVRRDCDAVLGGPPLLQCFEVTWLEGGDFEPRATGAVTAEGGERLFFVVTAGAGAGSDDAGEVGLAITAGPAHRPETTAAEVVVTGRRARFAVEGTDLDGDVLGFVAELLDGDDARLDLNLDGAVDDLDLLVSGFDADVRGVATIEAQATLDLGQALRVYGVETARIWLVDSGRALSAEPALAAVSYDGWLDEACGVGGTCGDELTCEAGVCELASETTAACAGATPVTVATPTTATTTTHITGAVPAGAGLFQGGCAGYPTRTGGGEVLFEVEVPAGAFDLLARTDVDGTDPAVDTVVYVRESCEDPASEPLYTCGDAASVADIRGALELRDVAAGTYTIFVEIGDGASGPDPVPFGLDVGVRPVLATGESCDVEEMDDRCAAGPCASGTCP